MKIGIISCEDAEKWGKEQGSGELVRDVFKSSSMDTWEIICAISGPLPSIEEIKTFDGFLITGSHYSVNCKEPWIDNLVNMIHQIFELQKNEESAVKLGGICFGHQLINKALGAKVISNEYGSFVFKSEKIYCNEKMVSEFIEYIIKHSQVGDSYQDLIDWFNHRSDPLVLLESHGEEVIDLPDSATCLASSETCKNEMVIHGKHTLTLQSHPELSLVQMKGKILPALRAKELLSVDEEGKALESFKLDLHSEKVLELFRLFLGVSKCD